MNTKASTQLTLALRNLSRRMTSTSLPASQFTQLHNTVETEQKDIFSFQFSYNEVTLLSLFRGLCEFRYQLGLLLNWPFVK